MTKAQVRTSDSTLPSAGAPAVTVRRLVPSDSIAELTTLLHRAYRPQVDMGLRPLAGRQSEEVTRKRTETGECYVAVVAGSKGACGDHCGCGSLPGRERIVGTILFQEIEEAAFPPFFLRDDVTHFSLFAVDPGMQGRGIGHLLLDAVERRARTMGAKELALSMAEPDTNLMNFYLRQGFRFIEHWQWPYTNYRSAILSKALA